MSEKLQPQHLARKAILYVRQSSVHQVIRNEESRRLQYGMEGRLRDLGFQQVEVVDDDLGRSASGSVQRAGFERMVSEVCLGNVGAVAAREVSRFARNSRDWQQLVEVCRMVDTVLVDQEMIYNPRYGNDRLLLGLKGSLNEYELDILRLRSLEARRQKAQRGELIMTSVAGYLRSDDGTWVKDPDRRIQEAIERVFRRFLELGTVRQTLLWFIEQGIDLPVNRRSRNGVEVFWRKPKYGTLLRILRNPIFAGIYAYGKTGSEIEYRDGQARRSYRRRPVEEWWARLYDHHEAYVDREQFERIQDMISRNSMMSRDAGPGAPKNGIALLSGLLRCRRCARKLTVTYTGRDKNCVRYICVRGWLDTGDAKCIGISGLAVDDAVAAEVRRVVEPAALEAAGRAEINSRERDEDVRRAIEVDRQAAQFAADRAFRQFDAVDPGNRLVADELERRWNESMARVREIEARLHEAQALTAKRLLNAQDVPESIVTDLATVWNDPTSSSRLKKRIVRTVIEEIVVDVNRQSGEVLLVLHWRGGVHTELRVACRTRGSNRLHTNVATVEAAALLVTICDDAKTAAYLNRNGHVTGHGRRWTGQNVKSLRAYRGLPPYSQDRRVNEGLLTLTQASKLLNLSTCALRAAVERGQIPAKHPVEDGPWILRRTDLDDPRVIKLAEDIRSRSRPSAAPDSKQLSLF